MRRFAQNKLWRDKAIDPLESKGLLIYWRKLSVKEFIAALKDKLVETAEHPAGSFGEKYRLDRPEKYSGIR